MADINIQLSSQIGWNYEAYFQSCTSALNPEKYTTIHQIIFGNNHSQNLCKKQQQEKQPNHGKVEVNKIAFL